MDVQFRHPDWSSNEVMQHCKTLKRLLQMLPLTNPSEEDLLEILKTNVKLFAAFVEQETQSLIEDIESNQQRLRNIANPTNSCTENDQDMAESKPRDENQTIETSQMANPISFEVPSHQRQVHPTTYDQDESTKKISTSEFTIALCARCGSNLALNPDGKVLKSHIVTAECGDTFHVKCYREIFDPDGRSESKCPRRQCSTMLVYNRFTKSLLRTKKCTIEDRQSENSRIKTKIREFRRRVDDLIKENENLDIEAKMANLRLKEEKECNRIISNQLEYLRNRLSLQYPGISFDLGEESNLYPPTHAVPFRKPMIPLMSRPIVARNSAAPFQRPLPSRNVPLVTISDEDDEPSGSKKPPEPKSETVEPPPPGTSPDESGVEMEDVSTSSKNEIHSRKINPDRRDSNKTSMKKKTRSKNKSSIQRTHEEESPRLKQAILIKKSSDFQHRPVEEVHQPTGPQNRKRARARADFQADYGISADLLFPFEPTGKNPLGLTQAVMDGSKDLVLFLTDAMLIGDGYVHGVVTVDANKADYSSKFYFRELPILEFIYLVAQLPYLPRTLICSIGNYEANRELPADEFRTDLNQLLSLLSQKGVENLFVVPTIRHREETSSHARIDTILQQPSIFRGMHRVITPIITDARSRFSDPVVIDNMPTLEDDFFRALLRLMKIALNDRMHDDAKYPPLPPPRY